MVGWDNSYKYAMLKDEEMNNLKLLKTKYADFCVDIQKTLIELTHATYGFYGFDLPDPITMAIALDNKLIVESQQLHVVVDTCLLYTSPSPRDKRQSRMPSSA